MKSLTASSIILVTLFSLGALAQERQPKLFYDNCSIVDLNTFPTPQGRFDSWKKLGTAYTRSVKSFELQGVFTRSSTKYLVSTLTLETGGYEVKVSKRLETGLVDVSTTFIGDWSHDVRLIIGPGSDLGLHCQRGACDIFSITTVAEPHQDRLMVANPAVTAGIPSTDGITRSSQVFKLADKSNSKVAAILTTDKNENKLNVKMEKQFQPLFTQHTSDGYHVEVIDQTLGIEAACHRYEMSDPNRQKGGATIMRMIEQHYTPKRRNN